MSLTVFVSNLIVHGFHGVNPEEKSLGQKFEVDIDCRIDDPDCSSDKLSSTVNYSSLCDIGHAVSQNGRFNLIETYADRVIRAVFDAHPEVDWVRVLVRKPSAPLAHVFDTVGVELSRSRDELKP
ncbi:MAG: dihydroneopterin aldolase [Pseudomonadota bacterium]